ncbi:MAG: circadian clock KaiB family protein [Thermodesulfobacteriota bacterium]
MYEFRFYVAGKTPNSTRAVNRFREFLEDKFKDQYSLSVIDILENPQLAENDRVLATPTLIKVQPLPVKKVIGDLSDEKKLLEVLLS